MDDTTLMPTPTTGTIAFGLEGKIDSHVRNGDYNIPFRYFRSGENSRLRQNNVA